jgi:hypothetical protein
MSRDHYKGVPKKRAAIINKDGDLEPLNPIGEVNEISGTLELTSGTATLTDARIKATSYAIISPKHNGPVDVNWSTSDGSLTVSGTGDGTVAYEVHI